MTRTTNARLAGFMFLFYIVTGIAGMAFLSPTGGAVGTAAKLAAMAQHATLTRAGAVFALLMMMNAFVLAVAIYGLTRDYDRELALLALVCRVAEGVIAVVSAVTKQALLAVATAAAGATAGGATAADTAAANALGSALFSVQGLATLLGATAFAIGSTIYCYLFLRARSIPLWMAWLGVIASVLLVIGLPLQIAGVLSGSAAAVMWIPMALFEVTFALWLLIRGVA